MNRSPTKQSCTRLALSLVMAMLIGPPALAETHWVCAGDRKAEARVVLLHSFKVEGEAHRHLWKSMPAKERTLHSCGKLPFLTAVDEPAARKQTAVSYCGK